MSACGGGGSNPAPAVVPPKLSITPTGGEAIILDGAALIPEEMDGSNTPISLGTITDDKNESGDAVYHLAEGDDAAGTDNSDFRITNNVLFYTGAAVDFESATKKNFNIKIVRYKNAEDAEAERSLQTLDSTINLQDIEEVLIVTPAADATYFSTDENGESFLDENVAGNGADGTDTAPKFLARLTDGGIESSYTITYRVANNENFTILNNNELYYVGPKLDFEVATQKIFNLNIERIRDGDTENPQTFTHTVNLKNLNDTAPEITGYLADGTTEIGYIAAGKVGNNQYEMAFEVGKGHFALNAGGQEQVTVDFVSGNIDFVAGDDGGLLVDPVYVEDDPTKDLTGFQITAGVLFYNSIGPIIVVGIVDGNFSGFSSAAGNLDNLVTFSEHLISITLTGTLTGNTDPNNAFFTSDMAVTATRGIVVDKDTPITEIIADFSVTDADDPDGAGSYTYSLSDSDGGTDGDSTYFTLDEDTGELRRNADNPPNFATGGNADNIYDITVTVTDGAGNISDTQNLRVVVAEDVLGPGATTGASDAAPTAAEAVVVPATDESAAEATPEAEATKPSIGRRILDYLFGSQEEHRQMQNQQIDNMFGDSDLDPINPQDPDML